MGELSHGGRAGMQDAEDDRVHKLTYNSLPRGDGCG
jgi:hypothetical protein